MFRTLKLEGAAMSVAAAIAIAAALICWAASAVITAPQAAWAAQQPSVAYSTHVQNIGWQPEVKDGARGGTAGRSLRVEAFKVRLVNQPCSGDIQVKAHVQNIGWQGWKKGGKVSGTSGRSLRVEALKIRLTGEMAERYDVYYRAHVQNVGDTGWAKNGEACGSAGHAWRMEAVYIKLVPKGQTAPGSTENRFVCPLVTYQTHVQNIGWQSAVSDGATGGTSGRSLRVEAFRVKVSNHEYSGGIQVSSHVQNIGWQGWVSDGATSGTSGRSLRVEALKIRLTGEMDWRYNVYYRTHVQNIGWTGWAMNGEPCGSEGYGYRMEAVQIKLVPKGGKAPGSTSKAFYEKAPHKHQWIGYNVHGLTRQPYYISGCMDCDYVMYRYGENEHICPKCGGEIWHMFNTGTSIGIRTHYQAVHFGSMCTICNEIKCDCCPDPDARYCTHSLCPRVRVPLSNGTFVETCECNTMLEDPIC